MQLVGPNGKSSFCLCAGLLNEFEGKASASDTYFDISMDCAALSGENLRYHCGLRINDRQRS